MRWPLSYFYSFIARAFFDSNLIQSFYLLSVQCYACFYSERRWKPLLPGCGL